MTKRRCCRLALVDGGRPRGRLWWPAPSAELLSFRFSINNQTRVGSSSSDISAGRLRTAFHHWHTDSDCPLRRSKTANTRRLNLAQTTLFYKKLNCATVGRAGGLRAKQPNPWQPEVDSIANPGGKAQAENRTIFRAVSISVFRGVKPGRHVREHQRPTAITPKGF